MGDARAIKMVGFLRKATRPATPARLQKFIAAHFQPEKLDATAVGAVIDSLRKTGKISVTDTKVTYALG